MKGGARFRYNCHAAGGRDTCLGSSLRQLHSRNVQYFRNRLKNSTFVIYEQLLFLCAPLYSFCISSSSISIPLPTHLTPSTLSRHYHSQSIKFARLFNYLIESFSILSEKNCLPIRHTFRCQFTWSPVRAFHSRTLRTMIRGTRHASLSEFLLATFKITKASSAL